MKLGKYIGFIIGIVMLVLLLRNIDFGEVSHRLGQVHLGLLLLGLLPYAGCFLLRGVRWRLLLGPVKEISFQSALSAIMIAWASNNVLPFRVGEIVRPYVLGKREGIEVSASFATVVVERVIDGLSLVFILALFFLLQDIGGRAGHDIALVGYIAGGIFLALLTGLLLFEYRKPWFARIFRWTTIPLGWVSPHFVERLWAIFDTFHAGIGVLRSGRRLLGIVALSLVIWSGETAMYCFVLRACGIEIPVTAAYLVMAVINLGLVVPALPGFVGNFQFFATLSLALYGVGKNEAFAFSWVLWFAQVPPVTLVGLLFLAREEFSLKDLRRIRLARAEPAVPLQP
ncbi:MAG: UPF0104 family protein [Deltaproteobacteria bacterium]|nr:MAG: UPF0104 family protein [Deltaproteobacteria bacterium]